MEHLPIAQPTTEIAPIGMFAKIGGFFGGLGLKFWLISGGLTIISIILFMGYSYVTGVIEDNKVLEKNVTILQDAKDTQDESISYLRNEILKLGGIYDDLDKSKSQQQRALDSLTLRLTDTEGKLGRLETVAAEKPEYVESLVNEGTRNVFRCFEILSGANVLDGESNRECPDVLLEE